MATAKKSRTIKAENLLMTAESYKFYVKILSGEADDEGNFKGFVSTWVTSVCYQPKEFEYKAGQKAYEFGSLGQALDFVAACAFNGYSATCEIVPTWTGRVDEYLTNKKQEGDKE